MSSTYEIDHGPEQPRLPGRVVLRESFDDLLDALCADIQLQATGCAREFGDFQFVISPTPQAERVLTRLMVDPNYRELPWSRTRVWIADDEHSGEGSRSISELLLGHAGLPQEQLHGFTVGRDTHPTPEDGYEAMLRETLGWREKGQDRPDYALLTMNPEGGIAGLAGADLDDEHADRLAILARSGRHTLTMSILNASRFLGVIAVGPECERILRTVNTPDEPEAFPAAKLNPLAGELRWYLDHAACGSPAEETR